MSDDYDPDYDSNERDELRDKEVKEEPKKSKFKDKWNTEDETCPHCGQVTKISKGLTRQNVKRLIGLKLRMSDFIVLFMLILILFITWAYYHDTKSCRDFLKDIDYNCMAWAASHNTINQLNDSELNGLSEAANQLNPLIDDNALNQNSS
ncbi:hypothetical protein M0R04_09020 [Candidatus Dojkabacteria bacterium]|jgi:hypothetical protein|nr:hypothetical protein [Candidatus Dojkabacteria bacterium]